MKRVLNRIKIFLYLDFTGIKTALIAYVIYLIFIGYLNGETAFFDVIHNITSANQFFTDAEKTSFMFLGGVGGGLIKPNSPHLDSFIAHYRGPNRYSFEPEKLDAIYSTVNSVYRESLSRAFEIQFESYRNYLEKLTESRFETFCLKHYKLTANKLEIANPTAYLREYDVFYKEMMNKLNYVKTTKSLDPFFCENINRLEMHNVILAKVSANEQCLDLLLSPKEKHLALRQLCSNIAYNVLLKGELAFTKQFKSTYLIARENFLEQQNIPFNVYVNYETETLTLAQKKACQVLLNTKHTWAK